MVTTLHSTIHDKAIHPGMHTTAPTSMSEKLTDETAEKDISKLPKTPGEKFYDVTQFIVGKVFILAATAGLAFLADKDYGPDKILGVPNYLKQFQSWVGKKLDSDFLRKRENLQAVLGAGVTSMTLLSHGGNFFSPIMKWFENSKETIANKYNKLFGTPEDVKVAHERLKDEPKQNWSDVAKGRGMAWATVFTSVTLAFLLLGKDKDSGKFRMAHFDEWFGRGFFDIVQKTKGLFGAETLPEIRHIKYPEPLSAAMQENKTYRFGKILAIDLFATSAGILAWNLFSRNSAKKRHEAEKKAAAVEKRIETEIAASTGMAKSDDAVKPQQAVSSEDKVISTTLHTSEQETKEPTSSKRPASFTEAYQTETTQTTLQTAM